jgi:DNA-binding MarR family transcriptional regulator
MTDPGPPGLSRLLLDAFRAVHGEIVAALDDRGVDGLRPSQAAAIVLIDRTGTRLSELAQRAQITKQAMMQVVDDLESRGSVRRAPDPGDARAKVVKLTAKGLRQRAEARRAVASVESRARRHLGDRRFEALRIALVELATGEE